MERKKLGLVVGSRPTSGKTLLAIRLAEVGLSAGMAVSVFLIDEGVYCAIESTTNKSLLKRFQAMTQKGATITLCSVMLKSHGVPEKMIKPGIEIGSLINFVEIVNECDKTVFFLD